MPQGMKRFIVSLSIIIIGTIIAWNANGRSLIGVDDAQIYLVYMQNLADGHGFVYNVGGEYVEGFTSLLWTLIGALIATLHLPLEYTLLTINVLMIALLLSRLWGYIDTEKFISWKSILFLGLIFFTPGFIEWTILSLLETGLWTMLLGLIALGILEKRSAGHMALLFGLLILCRPEAMLWGMVLSGIYAYIMHKEMGEYRIAHFIPIVTVLVTLFCLILWRISYFGFPLPNTYYAKVSSNFMSNLFDGMKYTAKTLLQIPMLIPIIGLILIDVLQNLKNASFKQLDEKHVLILSIVSITILIPLLTGGDHFQLSRFYQATMPLMIFAGILSLRYHIPKALLFTVGMLMITMLSSRWIIYAVTNTPLSHEWKIAIEGRNQSEELNVFFMNDALPSQGVLTAGGTAYAYKGMTIDLLGLNNVRMAHAESVKKEGLMKNHASFVPAVFYELAPDIVWMGGGFSETEVSVLKVHAFTARVFHDIHDEEKFNQQYAGYSIRNVRGKWIATIMKKSFVKQLDTADYIIKEIPLEKVTDINE